MRLFVVLALALAIGLGSAVSPFASSHPDGLEKVAAQEAFIDEGKSQNGPLRDYAFPGIENERLATGLAGFVGTLGVFAVGFGIAALARRRTVAA